MISDLEPPDDLRLSPVIVHWLREYARASDGEKDATVARMLTELNSLLVRESSGEENDTPQVQNESVHNGRNP